MRPPLHALALLVLPALSLAAPGAAATSHEEGPILVEVEVYVVGFGGYDPGKGSYVADFYLTFRWDANRSEAAGLNPTRFEFMNGRAAGTPDKIQDETDPETGLREVTHRIQANLYSEPRFDDYPYDRQSLEIVFENAVHPLHEVRYVPVAEGTGIDGDLRIPGWRILEATMEETTKGYPGDDPYSRVRFRFQIEREPLSSTIKSFLPPIAFMLVAGLGFFFHPSKVANRITLGTGMLIAAVGFHISQTVSLPPLGSLILFDKVMIAVYAFLVASLAVSTLIAIDEDWWKDRDYTRPINLWGAVTTVGLFVVTLAGLTLL